jgi:uncharacterized protein (DUF3820 family)
MQNDLLLEHMKNKHCLYVLPYGKFKGKVLEDLIHTLVGRNYLLWGSKQKANSMMMKQMHVAFSRI